MGTPPEGVMSIAVPSVVGRGVNATEETVFSGEEAELETPTFTDTPVGRSRLGAYTFTEDTAAVFPEKYTRTIRSYEYALPEVGLETKDFTTSVPAESYESVERKLKLMALPLEGLSVAPPVPV
jgi:hypothetical protein